MYSYNILLKEYACHVRGRSKIIPRKWQVQCDLGKNEIDGDSGLPSNAPLTHKEESSRAFDFRIGMLYFQ